MANEFIIRKGYKSLASSEVTGSLLILGSISGSTYYGDGSNLTGISVPYSSLTGTIPTWNQDTTGTAATASYVDYSNLAGTVPTWNQDTTGTAATASYVAGGNVDGAVASATTATTASYVDYSNLAGTIPTWNQDTTGTSATASYVDYSNLAGTIPTWNQDTTGTAATATTASYAETGPFLSSYLETDTLDSVTGRGATTTNNISVGDLTTSGDITVNGSHLKLINGNNATPQSTDYLFIGGDNLASADGAIYIGNRGDGTGYGYRIYYSGAGSGNNNKLILKSENLGSNVDMLTFTADGDATFAGQVIIQDNTSQPLSSLFEGTLVVQGNTNEDPIIAITDANTANAAAGVFHQSSTSPGFPALVINAASNGSEQPLISARTNVNNATGIGGTEVFAVDGDGDATFAGDVTVAGTLTAQEFHTEFVSASIIHESGSTKFGDTLDDNHDFTGSLNISGSLSVDGTVPTWNQDTTGTAAKIVAGGAGPSTEDLNSVANSVSVGQLEYRGYNLSSTNKPPASDNANGVITVGQHSGTYNAQLAFSSDGNMYWRDNPSTTNGSWRKIWDDGNDGPTSGLAAQTAATATTAITATTASNAMLLDGLDSTAFSLTGDTPLFTFDSTADLTNPSASTGTWTNGTATDWGTPKIGTSLARFNDGTGTLSFTVPTGMKTAYISHLTWSSGGYMDVYGVQSDGDEVFLRRVNTKQTVENTNEGDPNQHDGTTIAFAGHIGDFPTIMLHNKVGRIHLTGLGFSKSELAASDGTGIVNYSQLTGTVPTWNQNTTGNAATATTATTASNAMLLDGIDSSAFLRSNAADTFSGNLIGTAIVRTGTGTSPNQSAASLNPNGIVTSQSSNFDLIEVDSSNNRLRVFTGGTGTGILNFPITGNSNYAWTLPLATGTIALTSDITGTNSGTNTGDQDLSGYFLKIGGTMTGDLILDNSGEGWIKGYDSYHSIKFRAGGTNKTEYYEYGGNLADGLGHKFFTGGTTGQTLKLQIADDGAYFSGNVVIGTTNLDARLQVSSAGLGQNINDTTTQAIFNSSNSNQSHLYIQDYRTAAGNDWTFSGKRIQEKIDSTWMGYMQFNGTGNNGGISFGTGTSTTQSSVSEKMRIAPNGSVGIGTTIPSEKLQVAGRVYIQHQGSNWNETTPGLTRGAIHLDPAGNGADHTGNAITFGASDHNGGSVADAGIYTRSDGTYGTKMYFATTDSYSAGSKTRMMIDALGNVGIGTTGPGSLLELVKNTSNAMLTLKSTSGSNNNPFIRFYEEFNGAAYSVGLNRSDAQFRIAYDTDGNSLATNPRFVIDSTGNVGIGTTTPSSKLEVYGSGSTVLDIQGSQGQLFSITDDLTGDLLSISDISGIPIFNVNASGDSYFDGNLDIYGDLNVNSNRVLTTADEGSGNGIDADTLDGQEGSYYRNASNLNAGTYPDLFANSTRYNFGLIDGNSTQTRDKLRVWNGSDYTIGMKNGYDFGYLGSGEYAMSFQMSNTAGRGFWWGDSAHSDDQGAMSLTTTGKLMVATKISVGNGESATSPQDLLSYELNVYNGSSSGFLNFDNAYGSGRVGMYYGVLMFNSNGLSYNFGSPQDTSNVHRVQIRGALAVGRQNVSTTLGRIEAANDVVAYSSSDKRWKENIVPIKNPIEKVKAIGGYEFDWKELTEEQIKEEHGNSGHDVGVIAQEIEEVLPEVVTTRENGYKGVRYEKITPLLIEAIKEQQKQIDELKAIVNKLQNEK